MGVEFPNWSSLSNFLHDLTHPPAPAKAPAPHNVSAGYAPPLKQPQSSMQRPALPAPASPHVAVSTRQSAAHVAPRADDREVAASTPPPAAHATATAPELDGSGQYLHGPPGYSAAVARSVLAGIAAGTMDPANPVNKWTLGYAVQQHVVEAAEVQAVVEAHPWPHAR